MGEGLATGAAKAAEERTARELLKEQEEKKYQRDLAMAIAVQKVKNQGSNTGLKPSNLACVSNNVSASVLSTSIFTSAGNISCIALVISSSCSNLLSGKGSPNSSTSFIASK